MMTTGPPRSAGPDPSTASHGTVGMLTRFLALALGSGLPAWAGWLVGRPHGVLGGFLCANLAFAIGWYYSRKFVRDHLDF